MEGTNKAHENGEAMGFVGVRLTVMLGHRYCFLMLHFIYEPRCENVLFEEFTLSIFNCISSLTKYAVIGEKIVK